MEHTLANDMPYVPIFAYGHSWHLTDVPHMCAAFGFPGHKWLTLTSYMARQGWAAPAHCLQACGSSGLSTVLQPDLQQELVAPSLHVLLERLRTLRPVDQGHPAGRAGWSSGNSLWPREELSTYQAIRHFSAGQEGLHVLASCFYYIAPSDNGPTHCVFWRFAIISSFLIFLEQQQQTS